MVREGVTSRDVARVAGVSQATVSRVLHNSKKVAEETRQRVIRALEETQYSPNAAAQAMRTNRTASIGVVVERIRNPFYPEMLRVLGRELGKTGHRMILWESDDGPGELAAVEAIEQRLVDGLVFTTATADSSALQKAIERRSPVVLINRIVDTLVCDQVDSENAAVSARMASYFRQNGHTRLGLIGGPPEASTARNRMDGFKSAETMGEVEPGLIETANGEFTHEGGYRAFKELMERPEVPTAVFAVNDLSAFGALDAARASGVRVPDDVWIAGFDDIDMASWESFDLTTGHQSTAAITEAGVRLLLRRIEDPERPATHQRLRSHIVVRGSTAHTPLIN